jgi:hypothetical protein
MADVTQSKVVVESSLVPYIRRRDIAFDAGNLRPQKLARLFFDEIVMNGFAQKGNKIVLNSKKILTITPNNGVTIYANDYVWQGSSNTAPTFEAEVDIYYSANTTLVIRTMSGNFDSSANVLVENTVSGISSTQAVVTKEVNSNTSDTFSRGEGVYCANSNVYMTVIGSSGENILYVNENYATLNISVIAPNTLTTMSGDYKFGDLVFQTPTGVRTFSQASYVGKVVHYNSATGGAVISLETISGKLNVNTSTANATARLWNSSNSSAKALIVTDQRLYDLTANNILISTANASNRVAVAQHEHTSGVVANIQSAQIDGTQYVYLNSSNTTVAVGNIMYFTAGTGLGQFVRVVGVSGKRVELASALTLSPTQNTKYSIGNHYVDENGSIAGILNVPEEPNFKFRTGERIFTITDVDTLDSDDYTMKASAKFTAGGMINKTQDVNLSPVSRPLPETPPNSPVAPPTPTQRSFNREQLNSLVRRVQSLRPFRPIGDPVAQTFFTPKPTENKISYGYYVTSVDLFFGAKPSVSRGSLQLPVSVKITEVDNGYPTKKYIASATVKSKDVKVSTSPSIDDPDTITKFTFDDPVYLQPDSEYAIVIISESPEYEVYVAELGGNVLGADPPRRISEQAYAGSFFRSQNATTWTAYQNEDLMFQINKAVFNGSGSALFNLAEPPTAGQSVDRMVLKADRLAFPSAALDFKVKGVFKSNSAYDTYNQIKSQQAFKYGDLMDSSNKPTSASFLNTRKIDLGNTNSVQVLAEFASTDPDLTPIFNTESVSIIAGENIINNAGVSNNIISIVNRGTGYNATVTSGNSIFGSANNAQNNAAQLFRETYLANNFNIGFYYANISGGQGTGAEGFAVANTDGSNTISYIVMTSEGSGYVETPTVNLASGNAATGMTRSEVVVQGETGSRGGNIRAKYLTRQIALADGFEAGDLRVFMDTVRPNGTDIQVYYKVLSAEDPARFTDKPWVRMQKVVDRNSKNTNELIELEFRPNLSENRLQYIENGKQYPIGGKFKYFAVKVALLAVDSTVAPLVKNLRIVATPEG